MSRLVLNLLLAFAAVALAAGNTSLDIGARVKPVPLTATFSDPDWHIWCGAPTRTADGRVHLYFSRWPRTNGFAPAWAIHSEIAYAVAEGAGGPYRFVNVALPRRGTNAITGQKFWDADVTHNPNVLQHGGRFYLFYMGNRGDGTYAVHRNNQRVGVAVAEKPEGPWRRLDQPIIDVSADKAAFDSLCVANPAATVRGDGGVLLIYKAVEFVPDKLMGGRVRYGIALADRPEGPYMKTSARAFEAESDDGKTWMLAEDPFIWHADRYYAITRDVVGRFTGAKGGLALFESQDGMRWQPAPSPKVLGDRFTWNDGSRSRTQVERPALLFSNGVPTHLFGAIDGYRKDGGTSANVQIPLRISP